MAMNGTLYSETYGEGMPFVLLHGFGWHSGIWQPIIPELAKHYKVILLDLPGFGHSPAPQDYTLSVIAEQLLACVPTPAYWLGWSFGGLVATWLAIHHPLQVKKLITVTSSPQFVQTADWPGMRLSSLERFALDMEKNYAATLNDFLNLQLRGSPHAAELNEQLRPLLSRYQLSASALQGGLRLLRSTDLRAELQDIACPSLHIFGQLDVLVPIAVVEHLRSLLPDARYVTIPRAGHLPFLSHKKQFLEAVVNFL